MGKGDSGEAGGPIGNMVCRYGAYAHKNQCDRADEFIEQRYGVRLNPPFCREIDTTNRWAK